jgi:hypothetical protein
MSKTFTLEQINNVFSNRHYLTRERFLHYFESLGHERYDAENLWNIYNDFPYWREDLSDKMEYIIEKADKFIELIASDKFPYSAIQESKEVRKRIYYKTDDELLSVDFNLNDAVDITLYAKLIERRITIVTILDFVEKISDKNGSGSTDVFDGDIFVTTDESYARDRDDNIYVCDNGVYRGLLYTKGRGYVRNGKPDYDEGRYNFHVLTLKKSFRRIGNIYVDMSALIDGGMKDER